MPAGLMDVDEELIINNIAFPQEGIIEISYSEKRDHSDFVGIVKTIYMDVDKVQVAEGVEELIDIARELIDAALVVHRNPPARLGPRGRRTRRGGEDGHHGESELDEDD